MPKRTLISGISGMDGSYLAEFLLEKGYTVYGLVRRSSTSNLQRIEHILDKIYLIPGDILDQASLNNAVLVAKPDEVYHLASQSFVHESWNQPFLTLDTTGIGTERMLEAIRRYKPDARFYFAGSSEQFGQVQEIPQTEKTPFWPRSPYGCAKVLGFWLTTNSRESYDMFACSGILFNHDSERRGFEFVTRKITHAVARIKFGLQKELRLGTLDAVRDFGYAPEYIQAMHLMLQQDKPDDFVIATGQSHTIREWMETAFSYAGLNWQDYVVADDRFKRPAEVDLLLGDASKAKRVLGWEPKVHFEEIVKKMVDADMELVKRETNK